MLIAVRDINRTKVLCYPFSNRAQFTAILVFIPTDYDPSKHEGIFDSDDICAELLERRPDLAKNISRCGCFKKRGERVAHQHTGSNEFLGYFVVFSRHSRLHALELVKEIRSEFRVSFR